MYPIAFEMYMYTVACAVNAFIKDLEQIPDRGYIDGMVASELFKARGNSLLNGEKVWTKALEVKRNVINKIIPAFNSNLLKDGKIPSGNQLSEILNKTLILLESDQFQSRKTRIRKDNSSIINICIT